MKRRTFIRNSSLAAFASATIPGIYGKDSGMPPNPFRLNFAPHLGMFQAHAGKDPMDQLRFMAEQGFRAFEDNEMKKRPVSLQEKMGQFLSDNKMQMGVFVAHTISWSKPHLASGNPEIKKVFLDEISTSVEVAKRIGATWMTVVPGHVDMKQSMAFQTSHVVETLRAAAEILEPHQLTMVLEPLNFRDHPGQFLSESPQAYEICKAVNSPACKILFDIYHQQIQEGNLIPNIETCWDEIAYFQIGDNPGRKEPGTGEINYSNVFRFIHRQGYSGILGMEHGNSTAGKEGELAVLNAYRSVDP
ncbi:hydroxypyruvate isomerase family protein [Robiginitalea sp.]|uniref:hydroxypyruvate isomerase family protein n=1 Tax=Robiginitalea sp. TaxID=1902411 RepID=UPI003C73E27E